MSDIYSMYRKEVNDLRRKIIESCSVCNGTGIVPKSINSKTLDFDLSKCKCRKKFEGMKKKILAGIPVNKRNIKKKKLKIIKATNCLTNKLITSETIVDTYIKKKSGGVGLIFFGTPGNGKTTTALRILMKFLEENIDCYYIYFKDLINILMDSYADKDKSPIFKEIIQKPFLVIDELSLVSRVTPHMIAEFTTICKQRFDNGKSSIIISNYITLDELEENFGKPIASLTNEAFIPIKFPDKDYREDKYSHMKNFFE